MQRAINQQIETELRVRTNIKRQREQIQPQINELQREIETLQAAPADDVSALRRVISEVTAAAKQRK